MPKYVGLHHRIAVFEYKTAMEKINVDPASFLYSLLSPKQKGSAPLFGADPFLR